MCNRKQVGRYSWPVGMLPKRRMEIHRLEQETKHKSRESYPEEQYMHSEPGFHLVPLPRDECSVYAPLVGALISGLAICVLWASCSGCSRYSV